jgi:hypothetical protein
MKGVGGEGSDSGESAIREEVNKATNIVAEADVVRLPADGRGADGELGNALSGSRRGTAIKIAARELG